jgi:hypothetical protein
MLINNLHNKYQVVTEILNSMNWANVATYTRVLLIPLIIMVYLSEIKMANILAAVVFLVASVTDWLDGYQKDDCRQDICHLDFRKVHHNDERNK